MASMSGTEMDGTFTYRKNNAESDISVSYTGLFDGEEEKTGWDKCTIAFVINQESRIKNHIKRYIVRFSDSLDDDAEELYQELTIDLYNAADYDSLGEGNITTGVQNYVYKRLSYIIKTFIKNMYGKRKNQKPNVIQDEDGEFIEIFDSIASKNDDYEDILYMNPDSFLKTLEPRRYEFGFDLFQILYIHMIGVNSHLKDTACWNIVAFLNSRDIKDVKDTYMKLVEDEDIVSAIHAINRCGTLEYLENYVYGIEQIKKVIKFALESNIIEGLGK